MKRLVILLFKIGIGIGILWVLRDKIDAGQIRRMFENPWLLIVPFLGWGINQFLTALRLHAMLGALRTPARLNDVLKANFASLFLGNLLPGMAAADVVKYFYIKRSSKVSTPHLIAVLGLDRFLGLLSILFWAAALSPFIEAKTPDMRLCVALPALLLTGIGVALVCSGWIARKLRNTRMGPLVAEIMGMLAHIFDLKRPKFLWLIAIYNLLAVFVLIASLTFVGAVLQSHGDGDPMIATQFFLIPLSLIVALLPLTPVGIGTTQAALGAVYAVFGLDQAVGISVSTASQIALVALSIAVGGPLFFTTPKRPGFLQKN